MNSQTKSDYFKTIIQEFQIMPECAIFCNVISAFLTRILIPIKI